MNNQHNYFIETLSQSPFQRRYYSSLIYERRPRRDSYRMAIHTSEHDRMQFLYTSSSSASSLDNQINATRSLYTLHNGCSYCINDHIQRSISQPAVRPANSDLLLESATFLLDSPILALRPAHHASRSTLPSSKPVSTREPITVNEAITDHSECSNSSIVSIAAIYRIVFLRSFASVFALASLFTIEVLQTSLYPDEHSFRSLLALHLSSSISAFLLAAHVSHVQLAHHRWKLSAVLTYDRCSQILIVCATLFTCSWILSLYLYSFPRLLLFSACISGISLSAMVIKTFDHLLQLSTSLLMEHMRILTIRFNIFMFIYNCICHLALVIGGVAVLTVIILKQWKHKYILVGSSTCLPLPCVQLFERHAESEPLFRPLSQSTPISLTMYLTETKEAWMDDSTAYIYVLVLLMLTVIGVLTQANIKWTTSIMGINKRVSIIQYYNEDTLNEVPKLIQYKHHLLAVFIGFEEGYLFGSLIKFDVTCLYGLRHAVEILMIYGLTATISSVVTALIIRRVTVMTSVTFTTLLHSLAIILLLLIRTQTVITNLPPLMLRYLLFVSYGVVLGLWSTISIHSMCHSRKFSSSSTFAQALGFRYLGRLLAYLCALRLCQAILFYLNFGSLLLMFSVLLICGCCHQ